MKKVHKSELKKLDSLEDKIRSILKRHGKHNTLVMIAVLLEEEIINPQRDIACGIRLLAELILHRIEE